MLTFPLIFTLQDDDIGIIYQDVNSEAAVLVNRDPSDDALIVVSKSWNKYFFVYFWWNKRYDNKKKRFLSIASHYIV